MPFTMCYEGMTCWYWRRKRRTGKKRSRNMGYITSESETSAQSSTFYCFWSHWVIMIIFYKRNWSQCFFPWSLVLPRQGPHLTWKNSASVLGNHCPTPTKPSAFQPVSSLEIIIAGWISITRKWEQWKIWDKSVRNACLRAYEDQCTGV